MLLSDGKLQSSSDKKSAIMDIIFEDMYWSDNKNDEIKPAEVPEASEKTSEKIKKRKYKTSVWQAQRLKKLLNFPGTVEDVMKWDQETKMVEVKKALIDDSTFEGSSYSKMLIIIAGNIDDAYALSDDVSNADVDADVLHEHTKKN